ncbi:hypothetical protein ACLB2K_047060 [Fragaria x ananassa]
MAYSHHESPETLTPLLEDDVVDGAADYKGLPARRSSSGGWRSASFIIGVEVAERFAYYGISSNLITFLTGPLGQSTATAAENVNIWSGTASLLPLLGAVVADSFLGRYRTIIAASLLYILGLGLLTLSAVIPSSQLQVLLFFFSLYLVAFGQGGHKPCVQAFGADQFDGQDPEECKAKSSFFNWWYFGVCAGGLFTVSVLAYIQDNLSWGLGFGIPCVVMVLALIIFVGGTRTYRYSIKGEEESPFVRIGKVFVAALRNWRTSPSAIASEEESRGTLPHQSSEQYRFLNKALLAPDDLMKNGKMCTIAEVEEAKAVLRLFPVWATCLVYGTVFAQSTTFFTKQGATMDRTIVPGFDIPAASLQSFIGLTIIIFIPIYDRIFIPTARAFTREPSGITMLQRIGTGIFFSIISMVVAALVEIKRLQTAEDYDLVDLPSATIPMSIWWLVPQYLLYGLADVFTMVGMQEFFYDQVPNELRSIGLALYLSIIGVGSFLSSFLISIIEDATSAAGQTSWFSDNLNTAHLDYFYWLLAALSAVGLVIYMYFAKSYIYNRVAVGQGGHKPCVQAFGADQFDGQDPEECKAKSSFFNWWYFGVCAGVILVLVLAYIQDNLSWGPGFGIPCVVMVLALIIFVGRTRTYRYSIKGEEESPFVRIGKVFVSALRNWRTSPLAIASEEEFLNKALFAPDDLKTNGEACTPAEVDEAKAVLRLFPIWATCLIYGIVFAQCTTFFTKQGATMDRTIVPGFDIPAASLQSVGLALYLSIIGVGSFLCSFLISIIEYAASAAGRTSWFSDNLNIAHLDYFYGILAALSAIGLVVYIYFAKSYIYNRDS